MFKVIRYESDFKQIWEQFIDTSLNGTFLHKREYMEYHKERFEDYSLVILKDNGKIAALLPGSSQGDTFSSHPGLTYGGLIIDQQCYTVDVINIFKSLILFLKQNNFKKMYYKCIPDIYSQHINQSDLYVLHLLGAKLTRRDLNSVICFQDISLPMQERRLRAIKKAQKNAVHVAQSNNFEDFYQVLDERLSQRHGIKPTHSLSELIHLSSKFHDNIKLFTATIADEILAGTLVFETPNAVHMQYIISTDEGFKVGALDYLFSYLISYYKLHKKFFSFGISTTDGGKVLNEGLVTQKEGFGARSLIQDHYLLDLTEVNDE